MNEILIYDFIGAGLFEDGVTAKAVKSQLEKMQGDVLVRINSPGGDVFDGFAIHNLLLQHPGEITVRVDALAASAASVIAMAGDHVEMADNALMMIHNPWTFSLGDADEMVKTAERLEKVKSSILESYLRRSNMDRDEISLAMDEETWLSAAEAIDAGFADALVGESDSALNLAAPWIRNAPKVPERKPPEYRLAARARFPLL